MPIKKFTSKIALKNYMQNSCTKAIQETAKIVQEELKKCINEQYYLDPEFYPNVYQRTETFLNSVAYEMLSGNSAKIFIDIDGMHYKNGFNAWQVVDWATESKHGSDYYQTSTQDFWSVFIEWCDTNLLNVFKQNLRKYGLNVK